MAYPPNTELVAVGWIKTIPLINADLVATTVPAHSAAFEQHGFVQVTANVGGDSNSYSGMRRPFAQVDTWAYTAGSKKVPWGKAATLAAIIEDAIAGKQARGLVVTPASFDNAFLHAVEVVRNPARVSADPAYARYSMDLHLHWSVTTRTS